MSIARTNILFMPELLLNKRQDHGITWQSFYSYMYSRTPKVAADAVMGSNYKDSKYVVAVDKDTWTALTWDITEGDAELLGAIQGYSPSGAPSGGLIRVDQGLNTEEINAAAGLDNDLRETQYIIELDYRLGRVMHPGASAVKDVNFIDDDNIASYYIAGSPYVNPNNNTDTVAESKNSSNTSIDPQVFKGPRGNSLVFRIQASTELQYSTYLFTQLGQELSVTDAATQLGIEAAALPDGAKAYVLDTTVRVIGANTGYRMDIPIRYLKIE
jgi:hypothetical protein